AGTLWDTLGHTGTYCGHAGTHWDISLARELLGKKLSKGTKKELDDMSARTGITLKSCRRQVSVSPMGAPVTHGCCLHRDYAAVLCAAEPEGEPSPSFLQELRELRVLVADKELLDQHKRCPDAGRFYLGGGGGVPDAGAPPGHRGPLPDTGAPPGHRGPFPDTGAPSRTPGPLPDAGAPPGRRGPSRTPGPLPDAGAPSRTPGPPPGRRGPPPGHRGPPRTPGPLPDT
uniref:Uncharacterized protein n=1 Tax=Nothoprocta perdicaria TaxID=30464 RepID=A0A8C6ZJU6_NOTPE